MRFYKRLYYGGNTDESVCEKLKKGVHIYGIYAVCVCSRTVGMFEILSTHELLKKSSLERDYAVIALAKGWNGAVSAVTGIIKVWLDKHESLDGIREYYNKNSL